VTPEFSIIVAADEARGIGRAGGLPWHLPGDMAYYKRVTSSARPGHSNAVIMGRKTFESIPEKFRPLKDRINVVLSRSPAYAAHGVFCVASLDGALALLARQENLADIFVGGGGELYREALAHPACARVLITRVQGRFDCDAFLAPFERDFVLTDREGPHRDASGDGVPYTFETYARRR
jgi:dihydrofolate reductase